MTTELNAVQRFRRFAARPASEQYAALALRFRRIFPGTPIPVRLPFGSWFFVGNSAVDNALLWGGFEREEISFVERYLQPSMTVLDIGAHHGLYTLLASKRVGLTGKVVAFEPSPRERKQLMRNIRLNFCSNVRIEHWALGAERSPAALYLVAGGEDGCNSLRPPIVESTTSPLSVPVVRLDDWLEEHGIERVDFIKLDVEGGERDVLRGATKLLESRPRPVLLVEVYDIRTKPWDYQAREIVRFLDELGYRWFELLGGGLLRLVSSNLDVYDANLVALPVERMDEILTSLGAN